MEQVKHFTCARRVDMTKYYSDKGYSKVFPCSCGSITFYANERPESEGGIPMSLCTVSALDESWTDRLRAAWNILRGRVSTSHEIYINRLGPILER